MPSSASFFSTVPGIQSSVTMRAPRDNVNPNVFADQWAAGKRPARPRLRLIGNHPMFFALEGKRVLMIFAARIGLLFFGAVAAAGLACAAPAGNPDIDVAKVELVPHLAVYDLRLSHSRSSRSAEAITGRILY